MMRRLGLPAVAAVLCLTAACSLWPARAPAPQLHDFGPLPLLQDELRAPVSAVSVSAPAWLASDAIHYRLLYDDPTAFRSYADHRWAAAPAQLLAERLRYLLSLHAAGSADTRGTLLLSARLLEFEQDFTTAHNAQAHLVLEVSMQRAADGSIIAQQRFVMSQPTSADVQGAVAGLAQLADRTAAAIVQWARLQMHD